ncbi:MAG TPA: hypothetical protein VM509_03685 [Planctomycetota bacterium]|nr:hypothetical protein [Planctomycetota bacterium]
MQFRLAPLFRRALLALLLAGVAGLEGCTQRYHPQYAHAIGGGTIGKGPSGKKRGIAKNAEQNARGGLGGDPMAQLMNKPKGGHAKRKVSRLDAARARANKPAKAPNPFATGKSGVFGKTNPFAPR